MKILSNLTEKLLSALYPDNAVCIFCNRERITDKYGVCEECALLLCDAEDIDGVLNDAPYLDDVTAAFAYSGIAGDSIKRMKYGEGTYLGRRLSVFLETKEEWRFDFVTNVPMHRTSRARRGYNQAEILAKHYAKAHNLAYEKNAVRRTVKPERQALLTREDRLKAPVNTMAADEKLCMGKSVLVIDDVCTTGSTLNECARALKAAGAERVYAMVLAHG